MSEEKPEPVDGKTTLAAGESSDDRFNPEYLRISQDFEDSIGVKKELTTIKVRKPERQEFFRVHPDPAYRSNIAVLEVKSERETYLVKPALIPQLPNEVVGKTLFTAITRQEVVIIWPVRLPDSHGRQDAWSSSAMQAAERAMKQWVRMSANQYLGAYELFVSTADLPDPVWPELSFQGLLKIAFRDRYIETLDHPVIQMLRGLK